MTITAQALLECGYKYYPPNPITDNCRALYQRRFDDEKGKRYFITFREWDGVSQTRYDAQLATHACPDAFQDDAYVWATIRASTIDAVEALVEAIWKASGAIYYE